ncbi:MAG TPA: hypothetical protein VJ749_05225 [Pyrinomonadaceae bacterium]|jgi:hypothetical protein|nr:hypothetical protein [Pyrinomonadaceae bacterium]
MTRFSKRPPLVFLFIGFISLSLWACARTPPASSATPTPESASASPTPQSSPLVGFDKDLAYVRNGGYSYVFVFSRKDKKPLEKDDSAFLRTNAPQVVDWVITDGGKKVIAGTNFNLEEGNMGELKKRFVVEDYSSK